MKVIRWIGFIPLAFLGAVIAGVFGNFLGSVTNSFFALDMPYFAESYSGAFSAITFVVVGLFISPNRTTIIKNILVGLIALIGILSAIGSFSSDGNITGLVMFVVALSLFTVKLEVFNKLLQYK